MITIERKQTVFRLRTDVIGRLRQQAKHENLSLNNYVESILMRYAYDMPNPTTMEAIDEATSGKELEPLDLDNFEQYVKSL